MSHGKNDGVAVINLFKFSKLKTVLTLCAALIGNVITDNGFDSVLTKFMNYVNDA